MWVWPYQNHLCVPQFPNFMKAWGSEEDEEGKAGFKSLLKWSDYWKNSGLKITIQKSHVILGTVHYFLNGVVVEDQDTWGLYICNIMFVRGTTSREPKAHWLINYFLQNGSFSSEIQEHFSRKTFPPRLISARIFFSLHSNSTNKNEENGNLGSHHKCLLQNSQWNAH